MGSVQFGIPRELALALKARHKLVDFIETGTLVGDTAVWASEHFRYVFTVELDKAQFDKTWERFKAKTNIWCFQGQSVALMETFRMANPTLFWLDAHTNESCPVLREISAINKSPIHHVILVDDARLFDALPAWPTKQAVIGALIDGGKRTVFEIDDVLVAEPCL